MRSRKGFALFAAIWLLVALSAIALELSLRSSDARMEALSIVEGTRARAVARSGLEVAHAGLQRRLNGNLGASTWKAGAVVNLTDPWAFVAEGARDSLILDATAGRIELVDAGARLNLNHATEAQLRRLLLALHVDAARGDKVVDAILDWRDADDLRRANGAERAEYLADVAAVLPRDGPFVDIEELRFVRGIDQALFDRIRRYVSTKGTGVINLNSADPIVIATLPGMCDEAVAALGARRRSGRPVGNLDELADALSPGARSLLVANVAVLLPQVSFMTREVLVHVEAGPVSGPIRARLDAVIARGGTAAYVVWRRIS
jgi:general secretion pathway protein K